MYFTVPNSTVLADQLERLLINQELRQTMSIAARQRAMELTWSAAYQRLMGELQNHGGAPRATVARSNVAIR
jgi:glycosyltransferase involved in cell wall biosynthesis